MRLIILDVKSSLLLEENFKLMTNVPYYFMYLLALKHAYLDLGSFPIEINVILSFDIAG